MVVEANLSLLPILSWVSKLQNTLVSGTDGGTDGCQPEKLGKQAGCLWNSRLSWLFKEDCPQILVPMAGLGRSQWALWELDCHCIFQPRCSDHFPADFARSAHNPPWMPFTGKASPFLREGRKTRISTTAGFILMKK